MNNDTQHRHIEDAVNSYLRDQSSEQALLIYGDWGSGKTYYWENHISNQVNNIRIRGERLSYIYVSLYGINDINTLKTRILIHDKLTPQSKAASFYGKLFNLLLAVFNREKGAEKIVDIFSGGNKILCIDDIERSNIDLDSLFGFINELTEKLNSKVIVLAHKTDAISQYIRSNTKKVIGREIHFEPSFNDFVINTIQTHTTPYKSFLAKWSHEITKLLAASQLNNLRITKHTINEYKKVYMFILNRQGQDELHWRLLKFTLIISMELEKNQRGDSTNKELKEYSETLTPNNSQKYVFGRTSSHITDTILKTYYPESKDDALTSVAIFNMLSSGHLDASRLAEELTIFEKYEIGTNSKPTPIHKITGDHWLLTDTELSCATEDAIKMMISGAIVHTKIIEDIYVSILYMIQNNITTVDADTILTKTMDMERSLHEQSKLVFANDTIFLQRRNASTLRDDLKTKALALFEFTDSLLDEHKENKIRQTVNNILDTNSDDLTLALESIAFHAREIKPRNWGLISLVGSDRLINIILRDDKNTLVLLLRYLKSHYDDTSMIRYDTPEIQKILSILTAAPLTPDKPLKKYLVQQTIDFFTRLISPQADD